MRIFFFGVGYCARRLIEREPWIEASGTARTADSVAALRRAGVEAYAFDGAEAEPGLGAGAHEGRGHRRLDPAARSALARRSSALRSRSQPRRRCGG